VGIEDGRDAEEIAPAIRCVVQSFVRAERRDRLIWPEDAVHIDRMREWVNAYRWNQVQSLDVTQNGTELLGKDLFLGPVDFQPGEMGHPTDLVGAQRHEINQTFII
jgi:hypothetical protein